MERAQPSMDYATTKYMHAHDNLVTSEAYCRALHSAEVMLAHLQGSPLFRALYPVISPLADPTMDCIMHSSFYEVRSRLLLLSTFCLWTCRM